MTRKRAATKKLPKNVHEARKHLRQAATRLKKASDADFQRMLADGVLDDLLSAICPPRQSSKGGLIYDYLLENRVRAAVISEIQRVLVQNHVMKGTIETGNEVWVSPTGAQWFEDGVMFVQGVHPFSGLIGLYRNGEIFFAVAGRDMVGMDAIGPDELDFIPLAEMRRRQEVAPKSPATMKSAIEELRGMVGRKEEKEAHYQKFFEDNPWVFGAEYKAIQRHSKLNDENIPDFTSVRVKDDCRDIFELKQPFLKLFNADGSLSAAFHGAWAQVIRYKTFSEKNADYLLREKGLRFSNPKAVLVAGESFDAEQLKKIRDHEGATPNIHVLSYEQILRQAEYTRDFLMQPLKAPEDAAQQSTPASFSKAMS